MTFLRWAAIGVVALPLLVLLAARLDLFAGRAPQDLGVRDGRLKPPSKTPNSVSSQADLWPDAPQRAYARIAPIALVTAGDGAATLARLKALAGAMPGARIVEVRPDYLYVQFATRWLRFVDDCEFWFDPAAGAVQVRCASRVGRRDFGVNRARVEAIRAALAAGPER
jgi:uncharacterized protein (DUF1499 family)